MKHLATLALTLFCLPLMAQTSDKGLDERINEAFTPVADWWGNVVLHNFPGTSIPTIIFLLVGGALFFTLYFGFINIRKFPLSIGVVRGKYDHIDHHEVVEKPAVNVADGDVVDTIKDESKSGEVSHFHEGTASWFLLNF